MQIKLYYMSNQAAFRLPSVSRWSPTLLCWAHIRSPETCQDFTRIIQNFAESNPLLLQKVSDDLSEQGKKWPLHLRI